MTATATVVPPQPARLLIAGREILIPSEALAPAAGRQRSIELRVVPPHQLTLQYSLNRLSAAVVVLLAVICTAAAVAFVWIGLTIVSETSLWGLLLCLGGAPLLLFAGFLARGLWIGNGPGRFRFDRAAGELFADQRLGLREKYQLQATYPLARILAIQLLHGELRTVSHTGDGVSSFEQFHTYEMNLILDGDSVERLNVCAHGDWQWMRDVGATLAEFLNVPVVDQLHHGS